MADQEQLAILLLGVTVWNEWRDKEVDVHPDLSEVAMPEADLAQANLSGANLRRADFHGADLAGAQLSGSDLGRANLRGANLRGVDLSLAYIGEADLRGADLEEASLEDANMEGADLSTADLSNVDLRGANLRGANLIGTTMQGANLEHAAVGHTRFGDVDLSAVKGLAHVQHSGPSTIGIDTIYRSRGEIPEAFLRGSGVPENFLKFANTLPRRERAASCFICHSARDRRFCDRLYADLQAYGVRAWYLPEEAPTTGKKFLAEIAVRARMFDKVILVCSKPALQTRKVLQEMEEALRRESESHQDVLYPIRLDNYMLKEWEHSYKARVVNKVTADFRGWSRSASKYETALRRLLEALRVS